ncbi:TonB-dependent receptor domain-containing protein [Epilithonimonas sp.]|uniref:TonB-dependent receptor domain-containing protein n=1 Tax=Epilithonimonas sp. TaxID=2894511 RepID=UPI002FDD006A
MKAKTISISALFLCMPMSLLLAQNTQDTLKGEKKIDEVKIIGNTKKSSESNIIATQRKSAEIIERVGAAQLSKQGVGDVATAVTKATGTVKQEGGNTISVRGLLDRYNATTMNGLPIPSDDPENKNIDLSLLKTDIIDYISLEKVFNPRLLGDFGGANINIVSKEYSGKGFITLGMESGYNLQNSKTDKFLLQDGPNYFGTKVQKVPANALAAYNYKTSWNFKDAFGPSMTMPINTGLNLQAGKSFKVGEQGRLNTYAYVGFNNDFTYREGSEGQFGRETMFKEYNKVQKYSYTTNTTGMLNLFYKINSNHQLKWITNYIHSTNQEAKIYEGKIRDYAEDGGAYVRRADYKVTNTLVNQLGGDHKLTDKFSINWIAGYNYLNSQRPDRITNTLVSNGDGSYSATRESGLNNRYFDNLDDKEYTGNLTLNYNLNDQAKIAAGYQGRFKERKFLSRQMDFKWRNDVSDPIRITDPNNVDAIFNSYNYAKGFFDITSSFGLSTELQPIIYNGNQDVNSGFANIDYKFSDKFMAQLGVRYDRVRQFIEWNVNYYTPINEIEKVYNKFLPAFNLKYSINDKQNIRLAASRTYTLPQLKEMAPYLYIDVTETTLGNYYLKPSDNNNLDLKWEYFPKSGEVISLSGFGKYIQNPISRTLINSSDQVLSYLNAGDWAYVYGIEAEIRKDIFNFGNGSKLYTFINATYMNSKAELDGDKVTKDTYDPRSGSSVFTVSFDTKEDKLQGAADFVGNANLGLNHKWNSGSELDLVASYSYVGSYIYSIGSLGSGNIEQKPINMLDFTAKLRFKNNIDFGISLKNLLNPEIKRVQQNLLNSEIYNFKRGQIIGVNVGYKF